MPGLKKVYYAKKRQVYDQAFINEEEDKPLDARRFASVSKCSAKASTLYPSNMYVKRNPGVHQQIVIKPKDFTVRAFSVLKERKGNFYQNLKSQGLRSITSHGFHSNAQDFNLN